MEKDSTRYYCGMIIGLSMGMREDKAEIKLYVKPDLTANRDDVRIIACEDKSIVVTIAHAAGVIIGEEGATVVIKG